MACILHVDDVEMIQDLEIELGTADLTHRGQRRHEASVRAERLLLIQADAAILRQDELGVHRYVDVLGPTEGASVAPLDLRVLAR